MKSQKFEEILEDCLNRLDRGEDLPDVLAFYPDLASELNNLLLVAMLSRALPQPALRHTSIRTGMNHLLNEMDNIQVAGGFRKVKPHKTPNRWLEKVPNLFLPERTTGLRLSYRMAIVALVLVISGSFITLSASASGFSGSVFNNLKRGLDRVRSILIVNQPGIGNPVEDDEFPKGNQGNHEGSAELDLEDAILPIVKTSSESGELDPEPDIFLDLYDEDFIDDLKELEKLEKEEEKEADKLDKEEEKEADKLEKEDDKDKEDKDKDKEDKDK